MKGRIIRRAAALACALAVLLTALSAGAAAAYGPGDGNGDGKVSSADARVALRMAAGLYRGSAEERAACDVNYNGTVTSYDARMILCVAARIYDMSYITPSTGNPTGSTATTTQPGRQDSVPWDLIMSTTARPTEERTTLPPPTHPNNYYTKTTLTTEAPETETVPVPPTPPVADEAGTTAAPDEPTATTPDEPTATTPPTTAAPTTAAPPAAERPRFSIRLDRPGDGTLVFTFAVKKAMGLGSGVLNIDFDSTVLEFVSSEGTEEPGVSVNIRPAPMPGSVGCEFIFNEPLIADDFEFGTAVFRVINQNAPGTSVGIGVQEPVSYNWKTDGSSFVPEHCGYYADLSGKAQDIPDIAPTTQAAPPQTVSETEPPTTGPARVPGAEETARLSLALDRPSDGLLAFTLSVKDTQALRSGMLSIDFDPGVLEFVSAEDSEEHGASVNIKPSPAPGSVGCEFSFGEPLCEESFALGTLLFRVIDPEAENTSVSASVQAPVSYNWRTDADYVITPERCSYYVILK